ncbi:MAG: hypothetical protein ABSE63_13580 [Thermoguttaceae bacterium]|jgi:hypothetical protein
MDLKTVVEDTLDLRPIKKATMYAAGSTLEGVALGFFLTVIFPNMSFGFRLIAAAVLLILGAVLAVSAYSALKRRYIIVERTPNNTETGDA